MIVDDPVQLQPGQVPPSQSAFYDVTVHPYHGPPLGLNCKTRPDVVTARILQTFQQGGQVDEVKRDIIWVECKPPEEDQPNEWSLIMDEATDRLHVAHPTRSLWLILNIGLKWLIFYWDPANPAAAGQNLRIINAADTETWGVDPRIRPPPGIDAGYIDQNNVVHVTQANTLDCFSLTQQGGGPPVLAYQNDLNFLENCIDIIMHHQGYVGWNDPDSM